MKARRLVIASIPEHAEKRSLLPPDQRGHAAFVSFNRGLAADVGASEFSKFARAEAEDRRGWWATDTRPNNDFGRGDRRGNAILGKRARGALIDESELHVPWDHHHPRGLTAAIALIEDDDGLLLRVHNHGPRPHGPHGDPEMNRHVLSATFTYCDEARQKGYPVGLTIDSNNGDAAEAGAKLAGADFVVRRGVDLFVGWNMTAIGRPSWVDVDWSDHPRGSIAVKRKPPTVRLSRRCPNP